MSEEKTEEIPKKYDSGWLITQYNQAAEEYRHEDTLGFQVFFAAITANGVIATLLAGSFGKSEALPIFILVCFLGITLSIGSCLIILRGRIYQDHRGAILSEIEDLIKKEEISIFNLYMFSANNPTSFSKRSKYYSRDGRKTFAMKLTALGGARTSVIFLFGAAIAWVVILILALL